LQQQQQQQQGFGQGINIQQNIGVPGGNAVAFPSQQAQLDAASRLQLQSFGVIPPGHQGHQPGVPALGQGGQQPILNVSTSPIYSCCELFSYHDTLAG
jgi:paired amphipathic helix protein Sin3a